MNTIRILRPLLLALLVSCNSPGLVEIDSGRFVDMVQSGDIEKLVLVENEKMVEITLSPSALEETKYRLEFEQRSPFGRSTSGPHFKMKIGSIREFVDRYDEITRDIPRESKVDVIYEERNDIPTIVINWLFLIVPLGSLLAWVLIRRKSKKDQERSLEWGTGQKATEKRYPALRAIAGIYMVCSWITIVATIAVAILQSGWIALGSLGFGCLVALGLAAISESIRVFIDIEHNTRESSDKH